MRFRDRFDVQDVSILVAVLLISGGVGAFDWRAGLIVAGALMLVLALWRM